MTKHVRRCRKMIALIAGLAIIGVGTLAMAKGAKHEQRNDNEMKEYVGTIVSHNDRTNQIVIKTDTSTGHWKLSNHVSVSSDKGHVSLAEIWGKTKKVRVKVSKEGEVEHIHVIEWK